MTQTRYPCRPTSTDDLVERLRSCDTSSKEKKALEVLAKEMIKIFQDERLLSHASEAAALAPVIADRDYQDLIRAFSNAVIRGVADSNILEPQLLDLFTSVLRCVKETERADIELGPVMKSLQQRLKSAVEQAAAKTQYHLIYTLSSVLDAMNDVKTAGLSRKEIHEPLLKQLDTLSESEELRLAQAADYAHQALLGIPDDEGPYRALWRHTIDIVGAAAKVAGAVSTMDPAKLFDGLMKLQDLPDLVSSMVDVVKDLSGMFKSLESVVEGAKFLQKQKSWYVALRFTEMLIQARAFNYLEVFVGKVPCHQDKEFLCGICAQLEQTWEAGEPSTRDEIGRFWKEVLVPTACESTHRRVSAWMNLTASTLGQSGGMAVTESARKSWRPQLRREKKYASTIPCRKPRDSALPAYLLEQAWSSCVEAQVFYADVRIREYFLQDDRLMVERLSGKPLSMDQCYINLAIIEHSDKGTELHGEKTMNQQSSPFSLLARLNAETPPQDASVQLDTLFAKRKRRNGQNAPPDRILIRGQAGMGKSTLCKKMVHNYLEKEIWAEMFNRLLWVPLRTLKRFTPEYDLTAWLRQECFRQNEDRFAEAVNQAITSPEKYGRTLFILDGLDEVSRELDSENCGRIVDLLNKPHVIITSRPGVSLAHLSHLDLELETVGFYPEQVKEYIRMSATDQAEGVQQFIEEHELVQGLVRIPIQLEALCYSWDPDFEAVPTTMTALYQAIESKLWKKDVVRLEKKYGDAPLSVRTAKQVLDNEISSRVSSEINLLRCLAFTGLCRNVIEFDMACQTQIWNHWYDISMHLQEKGTPPASLDLAKLSFLRSSGASSDEKDRSYHFLHLTFQEYFAAQYFVEHWVSDKPLPCLTLDSGEIKPFSTEDFLLKEKYNSRYDIFWRFVAGLLQPHDAGIQLRRFFSTVEKEPRDLLGPTHQRAVMHCLSEVDLAKEQGDFASLRTSLEDQLAQWLLFECSLKDGESLLAGEREFPEHVLVEIFQKAFEQRQESTVTIILESLWRRPKIPSIIMGLAIDWLKDDRLPKLKTSVLSMLQYSESVLPETSLQAIAARLEDADILVMQAAVDALSTQSTLPESVLQALVARLEDADINIQYATIEVLSKQSTLPESVLQALAARLEDADINIQYATIEVLSKQSTLPESVLQALAARLEGVDIYSRQATRGITLHTQLSLPETALQALVAQLEDVDIYVRLVAIDTLGRQSTLPKTVLQALVTQLEDADILVRQAAVDALSRQSTLPESVLSALIVQLKDTELYIRQATIEVLSKQSTLPKTALQALVVRLEDTDVLVRRAAVDTLSRQSVLPKTVLPETSLQAIVARLEDTDADVRQAAIKALGKQSTLPESVLQALAAQLEDAKVDVREAAADALGRQAAFSKEVLYRYIKSLYRIWLSISFEEHITLRIADGICYIDIPQGLQMTHLEDQEEQFRAIIRGIQKELHIPFSKART